MKKFLLLFLIIPFLWACSSDNPDSGISVSLDKTTLTLITGKTVKLTATVSPTDTPNRAITWSTSDSSIATVTGGTVTTVAEGTATITVTSNADKTKTAQCVVTVYQRGSVEIGAKNEIRSYITAADYFDEKQVYIGWNLGNGFDAPNGYGTWTRKIDKDFMFKIKEAGYKMVRVPITWNSKIGAAPNYTIDTAMFNEVKQVVDWAYDAGLVTIINIHHDDNNWLALTNLKGANKATTIDKFSKVWQQIAEKFKDYGEWLIFEPFNELKDNAVNNWGGNFNQVESDIINELNQTFTDIIRASGGNNAERFLVVQPLCAKPARAMDSDFKIPTDSAVGKQIISMHYYLPENFALNGSNPNWGTDPDKAAITGDFKQYANKFTKQGYPLILGESGATYQNIADPGRTTAISNRLIYMEHLSKTAKENGIIPIYWDNGTIHATGAGENFGLWNRESNGDLEVFSGMQAVIDAMINAVQ